MDITPGAEPAQPRENVMRSTILIGLTFFVLAFGYWAADLLCYHPNLDDGINPLAPISIKVASN